MDRELLDPEIHLESPATDLARAAAAVVCAPASFVRLFAGDGSRVEAFHGLSQSGSASERADCEAALEFAEIALLQTDPLAIHDLEEALGLPGPLRPETTSLRWLGGIPILARDGRVTGVICVYDRKGRMGGKAALERLAALLRGFDLTAAEGGEPALADSLADRAERCFEFLAGGAARELDRLLAGIEEDCRRALTASAHTRTPVRGRVRGSTHDSGSWESVRSAVRKARGLLASLTELLDKEDAPDAQ